MEGRGQMLNTNVENSLCLVCRASLPRDVDHIASIAVATQRVLVYLSGLFFELSHPLLSQA